MQLTRFTDYALRTLIYLALHRDRLVIIAEIAEANDISENHLMKIVHRLAQHGYIETQRGKGGGMRLARSPESIQVGMVVSHTEDNMNIAECFDPQLRDCPMLPGCVLQSALIEARKCFLEKLDTYTVADLIANKAPATKAIKITRQRKTSVKKGRQATTRQRALIKK